MAAVGVAGCTATAAACGGDGMGFGCATVDLGAGGRVRGNAWAHGEEFLTIPYATHERFNPPVMRTELPQDPFDATNILGFGQDACIQGPYVQGTTSYGVENCLILNLYRPRAADVPTEPMPVLVWIFGGDNTASEIIPYNATKLAGEHGAVVAVVSYRLGLFGFSAFEGDDKSSSGAGNNGLLDVLAAAAWLKRYGAHFGADPDRMVVFGESSGATDAQILTMSPAAAGVFSGSIAESGGLYANKLHDAIQNTRKVARAVGCDGVGPSMRECLQRKPAADLIGPASDSFWGPTVDGVILPDTPQALLSAGKLNKGVSVLWGALTNDSALPFMLDEYVSQREYIKQLNATIHGEGPPGSAAATKITTSRGLSRSSRVHHGRVLSSPQASAPMDGAVADALLDRALELYPPRARDDHFGNNAALVGWFSSDQFMCEAKREVLAASKAVTGGGRAFMYRFDWFFQSTTTCVADSNYHTPKSGPNHADDMTFVFGQPIFDNQDPPGYSYTNCSDPSSHYYDAKRCVGCAFDAHEALFSRAVGAFWTSFARTGTPGGNWTPFGSGNEFNVLLHPSAIRMEANLSRAAACRFWDDVDRANGGLL